MTTAAELALSLASPATAAVLDRCLSGTPPTAREAADLLSARGDELRALLVTADALRRRQVGDRVSWIINRNINFTNVCVKNCRFCAFSRDLRSEQGYLLPTEEVIRRAREAAELGATEVCVQAGLAPSVDGRIYIDLCRQLHETLPDLHIHAFSPEEVRYGCQRSRMSPRDYLAELKEAGIGSLPGTSAEILDDELRDRIAPGRLTSGQWIEIITTAHELGIPTTATMMFGHVETHLQRAEHMLLIRRIQQETGGFTEFVPLSFVHQDAPLFVKAEVPGVEPGPTGNDVLRTYAVARLLLGDVLPNLQASWVKEGPRMAQLLLDAGVNDLGGTLINESISTSAGASHGQRMTPSGLVRLIRDAGRIPVQRNTRYEPIRVLDDPDDVRPFPLDLVENPDELFGSYSELTQRDEYRFRWEPQRERVTSSQA